MVTWLSATAHEGKYTYSHILEITHGLRPLEKIVLSPEFDVLKIALAPPRFFAKVNIKMKSFANIRATCFFFSVVTKNNHNKGSKIMMRFSCVQSDSLPLCRRITYYLPIWGGGRELFTSHL